MDMLPLLQEIDQFLSETGMAESTFGFKAVNDGKFVKRIRAGSRCWPETVDQIRSFIASSKSGAASAKAAA